MIVAEYLSELKTTSLSDGYKTDEINNLIDYINEAITYNRSIEYLISISASQRVSDMYYNQSELIQRIISSYTV